MPTFAGVRVQTADQHVRPGDAKFMAQIVVQNRYHFHGANWRNRVADRFQRQVRGCRGDAQFLPSPAS